MLTKINKNSKDVVVGLGEIGEPILKLVSKNTKTIGYDINQKRVNQKILKKYESLETRFLHMCIPFTTNFEKNVMDLYHKFNPKGIVIHSTISPGTTKKIQQKLGIPIIYSATRGVHKRMLNDLKRYTKFFSVEHTVPQATWASKEYISLMKKCHVKTKKMSSPLTLELAKIVVDTSYYGWLINYSQISNMIAKKHGVNYDEMWSFADEIHKFLGNRPKMFPGFIGGHCVIPNLDLIEDKTLDIIKQINADYVKILKKRKPD